MRRRLRRRRTSWTDRINATVLAETRLVVLAQKLATCPVELNRRAERRSAPWANKNQSPRLNDGSVRFTPWLSLIIQSPNYDVVSGLSAVRIQRTTDNSSQHRPTIIRIRVTAPNNATEAARLTNCANQSIETILQPRYCAT